MKREVVFSLRSCKAQQKTKQVVFVYLCFVILFGFLCCASDLSQVYCSEALTILANHNPGSRQILFCFSVRCHQISKTYVGAHISKSPLVILGGWGTHSVVLRTTPSSGLLVCSWWCPWHHAMPVLSLIFPPSKHVLWPIEPSISLIQCLVIFVSCQKK